jgi:hypothetical protein
VPEIPVNACSVPVKFLNYLFDWTYVASNLSEKYAPALRGPDRLWQIETVRRGEIERSNYQPGPNSASFAFSRGLHGFALGLHFQQNAEIAERGSSSDFF